MDLTLQQRAVLGAFVFYPNWSVYAKAGMRPSHIIQSSPKTFMSLFAGASAHQTKYNPGLLPSHVARICRGLCELGLMYKVGFVKARYIARHNASAESVERGQLTEYESPVYAPTEAGMHYLLYVLDWHHLPRFPGQHKRKKPRYNRYEHADDLLSASTYREHFERYINYDYQEAYKAKFKRARKCAH